MIKIGVLNSLKSLICFRYRVQCFFGCEVNVTRLDEQRLEKTWEPLSKIKYLLILKLRMSYSVTTRKTEVCTISYSNHCHYSQLFNGKLFWKEFYLVSSQRSFMHCL